MKRDCAHIAMVTCLVFTPGCQERERAHAIVPLVRAELALLGAQVVPPRLEAVPQDPRPAQVTGQDTLPLSRLARPFSPEKWLEQQAAAAWSGTRRAVQTTSVRQPPSLSEDALAATDKLDEGLARTEETKGEASSRDQESPEELRSDAAAQEVAQDETQGDVEASADVETRNQERWGAIASVIGGGRGFTGLGAGEAGYTGVGGGEGFTGFGAGEGFTGFGAGEGFTGMFASASGAEAATSLEGAQIAAGGPQGQASALQGSQRPAPTPILIVVPTLAGPWYTAYGLR